MTGSLSSFLVQKNPSSHFISFLPSILFLATPQEPAGGTITSSPGRPKIDKDRHLRLYNFLLKIIITQVTNPYHRLPLSYLFFNNGLEHPGFLRCHLTGHHLGNIPAKELSHQPHIHP